MDEAGARAVLERVVGEAAPPTRVDIALARRQGRTRLRWRLAAMAGGVPVVAAIAAVAMIVSGAPPVRTSGPTVGQRSAAAPHRFDPLVPYASFGWLPPGKHLTTAYTSAAVEELEAGPTGSVRSWALAVYAAGSCNHTSGQLLSLLRTSHRPPILKCTLNWGAPDGRATLANPVPAVAPPVNGHRAFWATPVCNTNQCNAAPALLVWNYAPGSWARLSGPSRRDAIKIAGRVIFGAAATQAIRFPVAITGVKPPWQVTGMVQSAPSGGVLAAQQWTLRTTATAPGFTSFTVLPQGLIKSFCDLRPPRAARHQIIDGFHVTTTITAQAAQICAPHARGMMVYIGTSAKTAPDAIAIFAHHLRLLGPNPAAWTTRPLD
jgi:hypothetical protein